MLERRPFALAGAIVSCVAMVLAYYAPASVMHRHIGAAMPILRDNFWLVVHVTTIMLSYAAAAMALILGDLALGYYLFGRYVEKPHQRLRSRPGDSMLLSLRRDHWLRLYRAGSAGRRKPARNWPASPMRPFK